MGHQKTPSASSFIVMVMGTRNEPDKWLERVYNSCFFYSICLPYLMIFMKFRSTFGNWHAPVPLHIIIKYDKNIEKLG